MAVIATQSYQDELFQANPSRMVVMLYDEMLEALRIAAECIERDDIEGRCNAIDVATELLATLFLCLDMDKGGEIAKNLGNLYGYIMKNLPRVNIHNDPEPARQAIELLTPLRDSWFEVDSMIAAGTLPEIMDSAAIEASRPGEDATLDAKGRLA